jgi:hypothetical protein
MVKKVFVVTRDNSIINRLNKTKVEQEVDHERIALHRQRKLNNIQRSNNKQREREERERITKLRQEKEERDYRRVFNSKESVLTNHDVSNKFLNEETGEVDVQALEDDFM